MTTTKQPGKTQPGVTHSVKTARSLREKVLKKTSLARSVSSEPPQTQTPVTEPPPTMEESNLQERIEAWEHINEPTRKLLAEEEETSDASINESLASDSGRPSLLTTTTKRLAVEMDYATKEANTLLLQGKEALEGTHNMKRECKIEAHRCLQSLYEIVLSLSDSRSRHKNNLEKERTRHAQELVRVERAHNKRVMELNTMLSAKLELAQSGIDNTHREAKDIRKWLEFETVTPHEHIGETRKSTAAIERRLQDLAAKTGTQTTQNTATHTAPQKSNDDKIQMALITLQNQNDLLRKTIERVQNTAGEIFRTVSATAEKLTDIQKTSEAPADAAEGYKEIKTMVSKFTDNIKDVINMAPTTKPTDFTEHLAPITERLKMISSDLKGIKEVKPPAPGPGISLAAEMAQAEKVKHPTTTKPTYAAVAKVWPPQTPAQRPINTHTLIVSSLDKSATGEKVIDQIRVTLDPKKSGARVDRLKKARNQKIILSCGSKDDLKIVENRLKQNKTLKAEVPKTNNPLVIVKDVLNYHTDTDIVEHILAQNKSLLEGVEQPERTIKVRYRKRARNNLECHPVLEVSPKLHRNLLALGKIYIGLQRRPVADQSPLVQCIRCLGYGHTKALCKEAKDRCSYCGKSHKWEDCLSRKQGKPPTCINCANNTKEQGPQPEAEHQAHSTECPTRHKWDNIARAKITYLC